MGGRTAEIRPSWALDRRPVTQIFIDGKWVDSLISARFRCFDPYAEQAWGSVPEASVEDVDAAACVAHAAFNGGRWKSALPAALRKLGQSIDENAELFACTKYRSNRDRRGTIIRQTSKRGLRHG